MWEISITLKPKNRHYLVELKKKLISKFKKSGIICVCEKVDNQFVLSVACFDKIEEVKTFLKQLIAEIVVVISKEDFMDKHIDMSNVSETCRMAFIKALVCFDYENDVKLLEGKIEMDANINIEAYTMFRCEELKRKWTELIDATSCSSMGLNNYEIFLDFLKFLIESIKPAFKEINVYFRNNFFVMMDQDGNKINNNCSKFYKDEFGLVTDLIMLAPEKINFFCENLSLETKRLISYIFGERIKNLL